MGRSTSHINILLYMCLRVPLHDLTCKFNPHALFKTWLQNLHLLFGAYVSSSDYEP